MLGVGMPAGVVTFLEGVCPSLTLKVFELANHFLLRADFLKRNKKGYESESSLSSLRPTAKMENAIRKNNKI